MPSSCSRDLSHGISAAVFARALYSASVLDLAISCHPDNLPIPHSSKLEAKCDWIVVVEDQSV